MPRSVTHSPIHLRSRALSSIIEREIKLCVDSDFRLPDIPGGIVLPRRLLTSTYYDTAAHDLAQARITLRLRSERGKGSLKIPLGPFRLQPPIGTISRRRCCGELLAPYLGRPVRPGRHRVADGSVRPPRRWRNRARQCGGTVNGA
jgi:hypothetical protein